MTPGRSPRTTPQGSLIADDERPLPQIACDRCSLGVMDAENPHVRAECKCPCHARVYVDTFPAGWGRWTGGGHMLANNLDALHAMAERLSLKREWFQGDKTFAHYDVMKSKRALAVKFGAVQIGFGDLPHDVLMRREDGTYEPRFERLARRKAATS